MSRRGSGCWIGGRHIEVNSIRNVFPKNNAEWLNWIAQGRLLYGDKEKIQDLINQQRINLADVDYLDLDSVAKVLNNFENPRIENVKNSNSLKDTDDGTRFFSHRYMHDGNKTKANSCEVTEIELIDGDAGDGYKEHLPQSSINSISAAKLLKNIGIIGKIFCPQPCQQFIISVYHLVVHLMGYGKPAFVVVQMGFPIPNRGYIT